MSGMIDGRLVWIDTQWGSYGCLTHQSGVDGVRHWTILRGGVYMDEYYEVGSRHDNDVDVDDMHSSGVFPLYDEALCRMRQYLRCQSVDRQPATPDIINCVVIRRCNFTEGRVCILKWYCMCSIRMRWCSVSVLACGAFNDLDRWAVTDYLAGTDRMIIICITLHDATFVQVICITYSWAWFWKDCELWGDANNNLKTSNCYCCQ